MQGVIYGQPQQLKSLTEYIDAVKERPGKQNIETPHPRYFFRGHSNRAYSLIPSIERTPYDATLEVRMIEMARNKRPDIFIKDDKLSLLAKMQHYGLPTRLLDFTINPLVALYFACQNDEVDGEILEFEDQRYSDGKALYGYTSLMFSEAWDPLDTGSYRNVCESYIRTYFSYDFQKELILNLVGNIPLGGINIVDFYSRICEEQWFKEWCRMKHMGSSDPKKICQILSALLKCPVFVEAQETIERQRLQQGIYLLIPNDVVEEDGMFIIKPTLPQLNIKGANIGHRIIRAENKKEILKDLDLIGINEGFLFGDSIDHVCSQIRRDVIFC